MASAKYTPEPTPDVNDAPELNTNGVHVAGRVMRTLMGGRIRLPSPPRVRSSSSAEEGSVSKSFVRLSAACIAVRRSPQC